jgi:hypothetical protein
MARSKSIHLIFSESEWLRVAAAAEALGMTPAGWVRQQAVRGAEGAPPPLASCPPLPPESPGVKRPRFAATHLAEEQFAALQEHSRACGLTASAFIRRVLLGFRPIARRSPVRSAIAAVNRASVTISPLVRLADSGTVLAPELRRAVTELFHEIRAVRTALLEADVPGPSGRLE